MCDDRQHGVGAGSRRRLPELLVERLVADDLPDDRAEEIARGLADEPGGSERLEVLIAQNDEILSAYPPGRIVAEIRRRHAALATRKRRLWITMPVLAAAAAAAVTLALAVRPADLAAPPRQSSSSIRLKGEPLLSVYRRKSNEPAQLLRPGDTVRAGDLLQVAYTAGSARHGVILSLDGRGEATLHFPASAAGSTALEPTGQQLLDHSYELDDAPAFERFFFVAGPTSVDVEAVLHAARSLGASARGKLVVRRGLRVKELLLRKQADDRRRTR